MKIVCLDFEGVLIPEIWISFALKTGIEELKLTTRDVSDYDVLMKRRIEILKENNLTLKDIQNVIERMDLLEGAKDFLDELRTRDQVIILSDTFEEFARPFIEKLGWPTIFCNSLVVNKDGIIEDYILRQKDGKRKAVIAFQSIGYKVLAAGDSYNDLSMIKAADKGTFFRAPESIKAENPDIPFVTEYYDFLNVIDSFR